jgi:hypothetical protein
MVWTVDAQGKDLSYENHIARVTKVHLIRNGPPILLQSQKGPGMGKGEIAVTEVKTTLRKMRAISAHQNR